MKLYPKKLRSLEELKREKYVLKYALNHSKKQKGSIFGVDAPEEVASKQSSSDLLSLVGDLMTSRSTADMALTMGLPLLKLFGRKAEKGLFKSLAGEVIGGYLKWKLVQFGYKAGYKTAVRFLRRRQHKHA